MVMTCDVVDVCRLRSGENTDDPKLYGLASENRNQILVKKRVWHTPQQISALTITARNKN